MMIFFFHPPVTSYFLRPNIVSIKKFNLFAFLLYSVLALQLK